ncbi:MAG TPA: hypothetical protein VFL29_05860 [Candidatus Dormibacteraeota bacterium]|nr:hypothetical protein [Candidatus Dormibacteraeota bacterium]
MGLDAEGYGFPEHDRTLARLIDDLRVMGPAGVERAANGWDDFAAGSAQHAAYRAAEKAATHAIEQSDRGDAWDTVRSSMFGMTESGQALISWKAEHGDVGHKAEDAAFGAALGLVASDLITAKEYETLVRPMSEALPWLLPEVRS